MLLQKQNDYITTQIAGENLKITKYTEEYLKRFEKFLLGPPEKKMEFLKDHFFFKLPKHPRKEFFKKKN